MKRTEQIFVSNLRRMRKASGRNQETFAADVGMSLRGYQKYEQGESAPTPEMLDRFGKALGVPGWRLVMPQDVDSESKSILDVGLADAARVLGRLGDPLLGPVTKLSALYLLLRDDAYLRAIRRLPHGDHIAQAVLKVSQA